MNIIDDYDISTMDMHNCVKIAIFCGVVDAAMAVISCFVLKTDASSPLIFATKVPAMIAYGVAGCSGFKALRLKKKLGLMKLQLTGKER